MRVHNSEIVDIFNRLADLLEIEDENPFRIRAYRNAARVIASMPKDVAEMLNEGVDITEFPGIGDDLAEKIATIVKTGKLPLLDQVEKSTPAILSTLMRIEGLGPKRVKRLYKELHIRSTDDLTNAITLGKIEKLKGFGEKVVQHIRQGVQNLKVTTQRFKLADAALIVEPLLKYLKKCEKVEIVECAGSFRRKKETVADLDILAITENSPAVIDYFVHYDEVAQILSKGSTRSTVRLKSGIQVDLRVVPAISYGAALVYFTGSKAHNIAIRKMAVRKKLKMNEYGVFKGKKHISGKTESEVYQTIGLPYIPPELREDRGEIEAALAGKLPHLLQLKDMRGDLHCHTNATDGNASLEDMAMAAKKIGYDYIAIADHSRHLAMTHGFDTKKLMQQIKKIDQLNEKLNHFVVLKSCEIDILEDGSLDLPDSILKELDLTVCAIHSKFNLSLKKQTERILRAMENPYFNILAHPTGRIIDQREAYKMDIEKIIKQAKNHNCVLEINAQPERLDLNEIHCKMAKEMKVKFSISTDAHSSSQLNYMRFGVYQAQRGWIEKADVINTFKLAQMKQILKK